MKTRAIRPTKMLASLCMISASVMPAGVGAQGASNPILTREDISLCHAQFAALQAEVVQHFRLAAADQQADANGAQNRTYFNGRASETAAKDPVSFYYDGVMSDGQGVGDIPTRNQFDAALNFQIFQRTLTEDVDPDAAGGLRYFLYRNQTARAADRCVARIWMDKYEGRQQVARAGPEPGPLGLQNMPVPTNASGDAPAPPPAPAPAAAASDDVFDRCVELESLGRSGIQVMWQLRNKCQSRISLSYCLQANFEAAGDYNLCSQREYKTHSVAAGSAVQFAFNLMPDGTAMSDGRVVSNNGRLRAIGHACANDSSPSVAFDGGNFVFFHC